MKLREQGRNWYRKASPKNDLARFYKMHKWELFVNSTF